MGTAEVAEVLKSGVYRIDLGGGWFYIGSSNDLNKRKLRHHGDLRRGKHCNQIAQRVFDKYGVFNFSVIGRYSIDRILRQEQILLDAYCHDPKCANIATVAGISMSGRKHSDESRDKMSAAKIDKKMPPFTIEHRSALSIALIGKKKPPRSNEHRASHRAAMIGRKLSDEHRVALSAAHATRPPHSIDTRAKISAANTARWARWRAARVAA